MKKVFLFYIFLIFLLHTASAQSIITIGVHEDGNAIWTMGDCRKSPLLPLNYCTVSIKILIEHNICHYISQINA